MIALDLFAGHGWGVACQRLGIEEHGIEIMPEARAIRAANGMHTPFADVWYALLHAPVDSPASTLTSGSRSARWLDRPATTVSGDPRIAAPGHHERQMNEATRVTVAEAAALQSYPPDFVWDVMVETDRGTKPITKTKQFLTIGNAVPPLLAEAILRVFL